MLLTQADLERLGAVRHDWTLAEAQAVELKASGLDHYNHNLDTSEAFYGEIVTTRSYAERLATLRAVRAAGLKVCCGGILGMGETRADRVALLHTLATLPSHPESVPINLLVQVPGTPLHGVPALDPLEFERLGLRAATHTEASPSG